MKRHIIQFRIIVILVPWLLGNTAHHGDWQRALESTTISVAQTLPVRPLSYKQIIETILSDVKKVHPHLPILKIQGEPHFLLEEQVYFPCVFVEHPSAAQCFEELTRSNMYRIIIDNQTLTFRLTEEGLAKKKARIKQLTTLLAFRQDIANHTRNSEDHVIEQAIYLLSHATYVASGPVGYAGEIPDELYALRVLAQQEDAPQLLRSVYHTATPAGKMYVLAALCMLKIDTSQLIQEFIDTDVEVKKMDGCLMDVVQMIALYEQELKTGDFYPKILDSTHKDPQTVEGLSEMIEKEMRYIQ